MNYKDTINTILDTSSKHIYVNEVGSGDVYEFLNSGEHIYPIVFLTVDTVTKDINNINDTYTLNGYLYYIDRLTKDDSNKIEVQSTALTTLFSIFEKLGYDISTISATLFTQKFTDMCAGAYTNFSVVLNTIGNENCIDNDDFFNKD